MDLVYILREGPNEELRFSLRSVAENLPHDRVWVFGGAPRWLTGVEHVPMRQGNQKYDNAMKLFRAIADHPDVDDDLMLMNDDMFVMDPVDDIRVDHRGPLEDVIAGHVLSRYRQGMVNTLELLQELGCDRPLSYELHIPMRMSKVGLREVQDLIDTDPRTPLHNRTLYGNLFDVGGDQVEDVKVYDLVSCPTTPLLSTLDKSFRMGRVGTWIRERFPAACRYEL